MPVEVIDLLSSPVPIRPADGIDRTRIPQACHVQHTIHGPIALDEGLGFLTSTNPFTDEESEPPKTRFADARPLKRARRSYLSSDDGEDSFSLETSAPRIEASSTTNSRQTVEVIDLDSSSPPRGPGPTISTKPATEPLSCLLPADRNRQAPRPLLIPSDNPFASSSPAPGPPAAPKQAAAWDPISSSAPQPSSRRDADAVGREPLLQRSRSTAVILEDSDGSGEEFPELHDIDFAILKPRRPIQATVRGSISKSQTAASKSNSATAPSKKTVKADDKKAADKLAKTAEREAEKERKVREKEEAKRRKAVEKEQAAAFAEANKIRSDKKVSTPEMIVDLPCTLDSTIKLQAATLLDDLSVEHHECATPVDNVVRWRRKVRARFNEELGHWEPIAMGIQNETHALVILQAPEFVKLVLGTDELTLEEHIMKMQQHYPQHKMIYLLQGMTAWMRKNRNVRNRQFTSAVRDGLEHLASVPEGLPPSTQAASRRRKKPAQPQEYIDEDMVDDALLNLQVLHGALIHHTNAQVETAQWIAVFTQHISTIPYRKRKEQTNAESAAFCMETGQVRTGDSAQDTYLRMLQEIARVTAPIAYGVASEFGTMAQLVQGLEQRGPLTLESVRKSANKDGALSDRTIGQAVSRRMHKVFTGRDEKSTDI